MLRFDYNILNPLQVSGYPCQNINCSASRLLSRVIYTQQAVSAYHLGRNLSEGGVRVKVLTPVQNLDQMGLNGQQCTALIAHLGRDPGSGHYIPFVRENNIWWRAEFRGSDLTMENPFTGQMTGNNRSGYTIDILFFT